jgi:hypothetical protein
MRLETGGEMFLAGAITSGGAMDLVYGETLNDFAEYFDNVNGRTLATVTTDLVDQVQSLRDNELPADLVAALRAAGYSLDVNSASLALTPVAALTPWADLSAAGKQAIAESLGYVYSSTGGVYNARAGSDVRFMVTPTVGYSLAYNLNAVTWGSDGAPAVGASFDALSAQQQTAVAVALGYKRIDGVVLLSEQTQTWSTDFNQGPQPDYLNSDINWGLVAAPDVDAQFMDLTLAQKLVVAQAMGYETDAYFH